MTSEWPFLRCPSASSTIAAPAPLRMASFGSSQSPLTRVPSGYRSFSVRSWFDSQPTLSPAALTRIHLLESEASTNPKDAAKQVAFWTELVKYPIGQKRIVSSYERQSEQDPHSLIVKNEELFKLYLNALLLSAGKDGKAALDAAARRREDLMAQPTPASAEESDVRDEDLTPSQRLARGVIKTAALRAETDTFLGSVSKIGLLATVRNRFRATDSAAASAAVGDGSSAAPLHVFIQERKSTPWKTVRSFLFTAALFFVLFSASSVLIESAASGIKSAATGGTSGKNMEFEPSNAGKIFKFSDVHGVDEAKEDLMEVVQFLKDPSTFNSLGGKLPKGILLTGPPGTGKTLLARAVAGEAGVSFLFCSASDFDEMFVGVGAKRIRELFATARKKQPAIIFIDELDSVGGKRNSRDVAYARQSLNQLLSEMDGFSSSDGVIVIGATNFPESLDKALIRPGRFDKSVAVPLPDIRGRTQILKHYLGNVTTSPGVDVHTLARGTPGFSGAELENMVNQAAVYAAKNLSKSISLKDLEWAKDKILMGTERVSAFIPEDVKRATAVHESGHALVALHTKASMPLHKVTCMPRGHALGLTQRLPKDDRFSISWREMIADIDVALGGRVAEEIVYGKEEVTSGCSSDLTMASRIANDMVQRYGYSDVVGLASYQTKDNTMSTHKREQIESEVDKMLKDSEQRVKQLLTTHKREIELLTDALVEYETLDSQEVMQVLKGKKIRENEDPPASGGARMYQPTPGRVEPFPPLPPGSGGAGGAPLPHPSSSKDRN